MIQKQTTFVYVIGLFIICSSLFLDAKETDSNNNQNNTLLSVPSLPIIDPGAFSIDENGTLSLYFERIDENGYTIVNNIITIQITNELKYPTNHSYNLTIIILTSSATLEKDQFNKKLGAKFKFLSSNIVGPAKDTNFIEIPSEDHLCGKPENIQVVQLDKDYTILWEKPKGNYEITSYTVFWCITLKGSQCDVPIELRKFNGTDRRFEYQSSDHNLKFAVTANTENSTSGMTWEQCKAGNDSTLIGQIEPMENIKTFTNKIVLEWAPKCEDSFIVKNYTVEYCPVKDMNSDCFEAKTTYITNTTTHSLDNLRSNTLYKISVTMQSETTKGKPTQQNVETSSSVWEEYSNYIMLGVILMVSFGISIYWSYWKITQMKNIKVNLPFGLDLYTESLNKKVSDQMSVSARSVSNDRVSAILEAETLDTASISTVELMDSIRKESIQSQDSAVTAVIQDEIIQADPVSGVSGPPIRNFMIHPVLNTESYLTLIDQLYNNHSESEPATNPVNEQHHNAEISDNGYVCLANIASQTNGYVPMVQLVSEPSLVISNNGNYVNMNRPSLQT